MDHLSEASKDLERGRAKQEYDAVMGLLEERVVSADPAEYGFPKLLRNRRSNETPEKFRLWRRSALKTCVEDHLWIVKDGIRQPIKTIPAMLDFLYDLFYQEVRQAIMWKPRGGGGSLTAALLIWLMMAYRRMSFLDIAGSGEQAKVVYDYTKGFWGCNPAYGEAILRGEPLQKETRLTSGVVLKTVPASEKQVRGKHLPGFVADESCQGSGSVDKLIMAAMQGAMSEPNSCVVLLSTFHIPVGLFQEVWDYAEERGFKRYIWDVYDTQEKCTAGLEEATEEDPKALSFCYHKCPLSRKAPVTDDRGRRRGEEWIGCCGKARDSEGFQSRKNVLIAHKMNRGTKIFENEFESKRPDWMRPIYDREWIERSVVTELPGLTLADKVAAALMEANLDEWIGFSVGIDWGLEGSTSVTLVAHRIEYIALVECEFMSGRLTEAVIELLRGWQAVWGTERKWVVNADASHPYNNLELSNAGFEVNAIQFNTWKEFGIGNLVKYFANKGRIFMVGDFPVMIDQLKRYRRDSKGKAVKEDDHGPDSLMLSVLNFQFDELFPDDLALNQEDYEGKRVESQPQGGIITPDGVVLVPASAMEFPGMSRARTMGGGSQMMLPTARRLVTEVEKRAKKNKGGGSVLRF